MYQVCTCGETEYPCVMHDPPMVGVTTTTDEVVESDGMISAIRWGGNHSAFVECDTCKAKPGSPPLCSGCLNNRAVIESSSKSDKDILVEMFKRAGVHGDVFNRIDGGLRLKANGIFNFDKDGKLLTGIG